MTIINFINENIIWGIPMIVLFIGTGLYFTVKLHFFQFNLVNIFKNTIFSKNKTIAGEKSLSPFQTLTSTLAVTLGTGNIAALGTAIVFGGRGAVFWMWVSAFLGMATTYAENYLGMSMRRKISSGCTGGVFFYIEKALGKAGGAFFALCCILASFGMGNMTQINAFSTAAAGSFGTPTWLSGIISAFIVGIIVFGGAIFFGEITEKVIPVISAIYILGCLVVVFFNLAKVPEVFGGILQDAFGINAISGGMVGTAVSWGFRRGVFSNEAGLGSSVILNSMSSEENPARQSLWSTLTVFFDTIVVCTLTAFVILLTGAEKVGGEGVALANIAFKSAFADYADVFVTLSLCIFALSTVCGWSVFGVESVKYLFSEAMSGFVVRIYLVVFVICCFLGAVLNLEIVWGAADIFNGLMALPNLMSVLILRKNVKTQDLN